MALDRSATAILDRLAGLCTESSIEIRGGTVTPYRVGKGATRRTRFRAQIRWGGKGRLGRKTLHLGIFDTRAEARAIASIAADERARGTDPRVILDAIGEYHRRQRRGTKLPPSLAVLKPRLDLSSIRTSAEAAKEALRLGNLEGVSIAIESILNELDQ